MNGPSEENPFSSLLFSSSGVCRGPSGRFIKWKEREECVLLFYPEEEEEEEGEGRTRASPDQGSGSRTCPPPRGPEESASSETSMHKNPRV